MLGHRAGAHGLGLVSKPRSVLPSSEWKAQGAFPQLAAVRSSGGARLSQAFVLAFAEDYLV